MRILVVDDNQDGARSLAGILALKGHVIRVAFSGSLAVKEAVMFKPDLVLMDIGMSGMDGLESCRIMRKALPGSMCIVAITGYDSPEGPAFDRAGNLYFVNWLSSSIMKLTPRP